MITTKIDGYTVDVDPDMGDGATGCWVSIKGSAGEYSASLALLDVQGALDACGAGCERTHHSVREETIVKISKWAEENGY